MEDQLNEVDIDTFTPQEKLDGISRQEKPEQEKTFPETILAVADRVFSRQGIARSILIQSVLVIISPSIPVVSNWEKLMEASFSGSGLHLFLVGGKSPSRSSDTEPLLEEGSQRRGREIFFRIPLCGFTFEKRKSQIHLSQKLEMIIM